MNLVRAGLGVWRIWPVAICFGLLLSVVSIGSVSAQDAIALAKARPLGSVVTLTGIVTNGSELGSTRFIQDTTGAIAAFPGSGSAGGFESLVGLADEVSLTGVLSLYHGLLELNPVLAFEVLSAGNTLPVPQEIDLNDLDGDMQSMLVKVVCLQLDSKVFTSGQQTIQSSSGIGGVVFLESFNELVGHAPEGAFDLIGIASFFDQPQMLPRSMQDITGGECFRIVSGPEQSDIAEESFKIMWSSSIPGQSILVIQSEPGIIDTLFDGPIVADHAMLVTGLQPAVFYDVSVGAIVGSDTAITPSRKFTTASTSTGEISVYFNQEIRSEFSNGATPDGTTFSEMHDAILNMINEAETTIDITMYNNNRDEIVNALEVAYQAGVRVRYITDDATSNNALSQLPDFPVYFRSGAGIMHNKFIVVDHHDADLAKIWTGSTNFSTNQLALDPNNSILIQDQALARAYLLEFEEMWGGTTDLPNPSLRRVGSEKRDNTPHQFLIGGRAVECYFSPSDRVNQTIMRLLNTADHTIDVGLLIFTRFDIADVLAGRIQAGVNVRLIIDDMESSGVPFSIVTGAGGFAEFHVHNSIFHHKYAIIDADFSSDPFVLTGSHNWTTSATTINDENTLVIHDEDITNMYRQEFEARWSEVFTSLFTLQELGLRVYPNPFNKTIHITGDEGISEMILYTVSGNQLVRSNSADLQLESDGIPPGAYILTITVNSGVRLSIPMIKI